jgi:hypothetical protein
MATPRAAPASTRTLARAVADRPSSTRLAAATRLAAPPPAPASRIPRLPPTRLAPTRPAPTRPAPTRHLRSSSLIAPARFTRRR